MDNYSQSIQYSLDRVKASAEELAVDFMDSNFLKSIVEFGNSSIQALDKIIEKGSKLIPIIGALSGGVLAFKDRNKDSSRGNYPQMEDATVLFNLCTTGVVFQIA